MLPLIQLVSMPFLVAWGGWVLTKLWAWHIAPIFGLPRLDLVGAIGVVLVANYIFAKTEINLSEEKDPDERALAFIFTGILKPAFALFFGWVLTLFL